MSYFNRFLSALLLSWIMTFIDLLLNWEYIVFPADDASWFNNPCFEGGFFGDETGECWHFLLDKWLTVNDKSLPKFMDLDHMSIYPPSNHPIHPIDPSIDTHTCPFFHQSVNHPTSQYIYPSIHQSTLLIINHYSIPSPINPTPTTLSGPIQELMHVTNEH